MNNFQLIFNLKSFESLPNPAKWRSALFGRIVEGEDVLNRLSQRRISHRVGIGVTDRIPSRILVILPLIYVKAILMPITLPSTVEEIYE